MTKELDTHTYLDSCGNIFADLELDDADGLSRRSQVGYLIREILKSLNLVECDIADLLEMNQPEVLNLMQGKYHLFSERRLMTLLNQLHQRVVSQLPQRDEGDPVQKSLSDFRSSVPVAELQDFDAIRQQVFRDRSYRMD